MQIFFCTARNKLGISSSSSGKLLSKIEGSRCNSIVLKVNCGDAISAINTGTIGGAIRKDRLDVGITERELSKITGVCDRTITKYENGWLEEDKLDPHILIKIANALGKPDNTYLNEYHRWVVGDFSQDIVRLLDDIRGTGIDKVCKELNTTHASLYHWSRGVGKPTRKVYEYIKNGRG